MSEILNEIEIDGLNDIEEENTSIDDINSENINLIFIALDKSGSMGEFENEMKIALKNFKDALASSKEADEILVARADFSSRLNINIGGYKKIAEFDTGFNSGGVTAMYDTIIEGAKKLTEYRDFLKKEGMRVKCVFAVFSDGLDNDSISDFRVARNAVEKMNAEEVTTAFISFGGEADQTAADLTFKNILKPNGSASELRKAFDCLSKSVIESSKSVLPDTGDFFQM